MLNFNEANVNIYLQSIANDQNAIQAFANDMSNNFVNCFQVRFIMTPTDVNSLNSWPDAVKLQISSMLQTVATLHGIFGSDPLLWSINGFESQGGILAITNSVEVEVEIKTKTDTTTGNTIIEARATAKFAIC
ncbi:MAG TPA: hypothetical protein PLE30_10500 [Candidatus Kapabacteria bacterium]|nr:hypothetical protein [Candidatus Kapabacteria bacterium]